MRLTGAVLGTKYSPDDHRRRCRLGGQTEACEAPRGRGVLPSPGAAASSPPVRPGGGVNDRGGPGKSRERKREEFGGDNLFCMKHARTQRRSDKFFVELQLGRLVQLCGVFSLNPFI